MAASTLCPPLAQESVRVLRRRGVETVILAGADTHGIMRGKRLPIAELDVRHERGIALCDVIWALPVDEVEPVQPPRGTTAGSRAPAIRTARVPDLETARIVPWHDRTRCCCALRRSRRARHPAVAARRPALGGRSRAVDGRRADRRDRARVLRAARDAAVGAREAAVAARGGRGAAERVRRGRGLAPRGLRRRRARDAAGVRARRGGVRAGGGSGPVRDQRARRPRAPRRRRGVPAQERGEGDRRAPRAVGDVHGQAALRLAGQLVPPARQPARRRARRDAPLIGGCSTRWRS